MRAYRYTLSLPLSLSVFITGDRNKGWYYGENVRTGKRGWFPLAYTEQVKDVDVVNEQTTPGDRLTKLARTQISAQLQFQLTVR